MAVNLFMLTAFTASAQPVTAYYLSKSGDDMNKGSYAKPFRTIQKLNSLKLQPDTRVYLEGGAVFKGPLILDDDENGKKKHPVYITSYGKGVATINGNLKEAIIVNSSHFVISNLHIKGPGRKEGNITNGISVNASHTAIITNVVTEGFQKSGIELNNCHDMLLNKIMARNNGFSGIYVRGIKSVSKNITIANCKAENNAGDPTNFTNHSGNGILVAGSDSVTISYCTATNNGWDMPRKGNGPVGIWGYDCDHLTVRYCISYKNKTQSGASDGGGFDFDGGITNSLMEYCLSYENQGSGYGLFQFKGASLWSNNTIRYCVSVNDGQTISGAGGFLVWNESGDTTEMNNCVVYNNVVYNTRVPAIRFDNKSANANFLFANNIFISSNDIISGPSSGEKFIGNVWWNIAGGSITFRGYKSLKKWSAATGQEKLRDVVQGKQADPLMAGALSTDLTDPHKLRSLHAFKLKPGTPLKAGGINLGLLFNIKVPASDFFGNAIQKHTTTPGIYELSK